MLTATEYLTSGEYYWNSGMFSFNVKRYLDELASFRPDILEACKQAMAEAKLDSVTDFIRINVDDFSACPDESVDYDVMEKTKDSDVIPLVAGWSDVAQGLRFGKFTNMAAMVMP